MEIWHHPDAFRSLQPTSTVGFWNLCFFLCVEFLFLPVSLQKIRRQSLKVHGTGRAQEVGRGRWCLILQSAAGGEGHQRQGQWQRVEVESCLA